MSGSTMGSRTDAGLGAAPWGVALLRPLARALARLRHEWRMRRDIDHLLALDDRMLADIGLSRSMIEYAARHGRFPR